MNIINLTPHELVLVTASGHAGYTIPPSGTVARCAEQRVQIAEINELPVYETIYGEVTGLPDPEPGTVFVVSALVAKAAGRDDVFAPGPAKRDAEGKVIAAEGLSRVR